MRKIKLLDCTLRDGGYINNWRFGAEVMSKVVRKVIIAGVDVIEGGYISVKESGDKDVARFDSLEDTRRVISDKGDMQDFAFMINYGEFPIENISNATDESPILRIAFHKKNIDEAFNYFRKVEDKGYRYFVQPMGALNYTDEEYVELIRRTNKLNTEAFYVVDSFGVMELKDFRRLIFLADNNLDKSKMLGYHAHNNLQQAYGNAKYMVEQNLEHDLIIDASVFGMGRGAGNLNIELFAKYLNENCGSHYDIEPFLEVFDECLKPIFMHTFWGYSLPFYLSSIHNCHPNYAMFLAEKNTLTVKSIHEILQMIPAADKISFTKDKANAYYNDYQEKWMDDREALQELEDELSGRNVTILAPGKSLTVFHEDIARHIQETNSVVIGVNRASEKYRYDFLFVANEKRLTEEKPDNVSRYIKTSNLDRVYDDTVIVNYSSYLCQNARISDDPTLMLLNLLHAIGITEVSVAGFDGFSANPEDNYYKPNLSMGTALSSKIEKNALIANQLKKTMESMKVDFLTPSKYV